MATCRINNDNTTTRRHICQYLLTILSSPSALIIANTHDNNRATEDLQDSHIHCNSLDHQDEEPQDSTTAAVLKPRVAERPKLPPETLKAQAENLS